MPGTELVHMKDVQANYIRAFEGTVIDRGAGYIVLDRTAFYPESGGQPSDRGTLFFDGGQVIVKEVRKERQIRHFLDGALPASVNSVRGEIDWELRYAHMKMHTAQHIVSGVVFDDYRARTVGNQIHADTTRTDFSPVSFTPEMLSALELKVNGIFSSALPVTIYEEDRSVLETQMGLERANFGLLPKSVTRLRVVKVGEIDICPCAGTHVRNTSEIGQMKIIRKENKGKDRERITYTLGTVG